MKAFLLSSSCSSGRKERSSLPFPPFLPFPVPPLGAQWCAAACGREWTWEEPRPKVRFRLPCETFEFRLLESKLGSMRLSLLPPFTHLTQQDVRSLLPQDPLDLSLTLLSSQA